MYPNQGFNPYPPPGGGGMGFTQPPPPGGGGGGLGFSQPPPSGGGQPGYPSQPGYPPSSGYPGQPAYPTQQPYPGQPAYPSQPAYPAQPAYPSQPSYPPQPSQGSYPPPAGYPQSSGPPGGYGGYPPPHSSYPQPPSSYPPTSSPQAYPSYQPPPSGYHTGGGVQNPSQYSNSSGPPPQNPYGQQPPGSYPGVSQQNPAGGFPPPAAAPSNPYYSQQQPPATAPPSAPGDHLHIQMAGMNIASGGSAQYPTRVYEGTCKPKFPFDKEADAQALRKAMKGIGTDEKAIVNILCKRSNKQRQEIRDSFKQSFGRDLIKDLKSELSGNFERVILAIMLPSDEYDAECLRKAIKGLGTNDDTLIEILCSRTNEEIAAAKAAYTRLYKTTLEKDIIGDTSGDYGRLLVQMQNGSRDPDHLQVDQQKAVNDAKRIYETGEKVLGTDEETWRMIFGTRSWPQLNAMFLEYGKLYKKDITAAVKGELSFNFKQTVLSIIACARDRPNFFAQRLRASMKGLGTDENALTRLVVSRCEKDMVQVKDAFQRANGASLEKWIKDDVGGDYCKALLALL